MAQENTTATVGEMLAGGRAHEALAVAREVVAQRPSDPSWLHVLAVALHLTGSNEEAAGVLLRSLQLAPGNPLAWNSYAAIHTGRADFGAAERALREALRLKDDYFEARFNLALVLRRRGDFEGAAAEIQRVRAMRPDFAPAQAEEAALRLEAAVASQNQAIAQDGRGETEEAKRNLAQAVAEHPGDAALLSVLVHLKIRDCDWDGLDALVEELRPVAARPSLRPAHPPLAMYLEPVGPEEQRRWAENWARIRFPAQPPLAQRARARGKWIKVGFLSGDFREHATSILMAAMLERHDRERFEFVAYSYGRDDGSDLRMRVQRAFDRFTDIGTLAMHDAAARIHADGIDILLDLAGHVDGSRLDILSHRPAPVQGHFLGYPGTTGAPFVDFFIADRITVPPGAEAHFTERILRMPHCYQPNDPARVVPPAPPRSACGLPEDGLVICSMNQPIKIDARVFGHWCRLLRALPGACLWLLGFNARSQKNLRAHAQANGVDPSRLVFAGRVPQAEHLARLRNADIALDTFPCNSHTTASDVLWAGVPLITTRGATFASRVAASVLTAADCADWVFDDPERAFAATLAMAGDARALLEAKSRVEAARVSSPLFDARQYTFDFEALLESALGLRPR